MSGGFWIMTSLMKCSTYSSVSSAHDRLLGHGRSYQDIGYLCCARKIEATDYHPGNIFRLQQPLRMVATILDAVQPSLAWRGGASGKYA